MKCFGVFLETEKKPGTEREAGALFTKALHHKHDIRPFGMWRDDTRALDYTRKRGSRENRGTFLVTSADSPDPSIPWIVQHIHQCLPMSVRPAGAGPCSCRLRCCCWVNHFVFARTLKHAQGQLLGKRSRERIPVHPASTCALNTP